MNKYMAKGSFSLRDRLILITYVLAFIAGLFCAWQSIKTAQSRMMANAYDTALSEQFRIGYAIKKMAEGNNYTKEDENIYLFGSVRNSANSYAEYYDADATYRIVEDSAGTIYSNILDEYVLQLELSPKTDGTISYFINQFDDKTLIFVSSYIKIYQSLFRLDYIQDITDLMNIQKGLSNKIAINLFLTEIILFVALNLTITKALGPLNSLQKQAMEIAMGNYTQQVEIIHNDEVGQLAMSFNDMSGAVEKHVFALSETVRSKEIFASNLAHEIKTPITSIVAYSDYAARKDIDKEEFHDVLEYIKKEGQRISALSDKILKWNSVSYRNEIDVKPCRPQRIIEQAIYTLQPFAEKKNQEIKVENHTKIIYADETLIISLIVNLCKNALNASDEGGCIYLTIKNREDESLIIKVMDSGIGIEKEELKKITDPFYMVDKARDRNKGGSGLGLSLCLAITEAHNGRMEIDSVFGESTCVTIIIPQKELEFTTL